MKYPCIGLTVEEMDGLYQSQQLTDSDSIFRASSFIQTLVPLVKSGAAHLFPEWLPHPDTSAADTKIRLDCLIIPQSSVCISHSF